MKDLGQKIPSFPNCDNYGIHRASNPNPLNDDTKTNDNELHQQLCVTFKIDYLQEMDIIMKVKARLECNIIYDVTVSFNDNTSANKMTHFRRTASEAHLHKIVQNGRKEMSNVAMVHPECRVFCMMPHPPPHIWAHTHNQSLQPLYLSTTITTSFIIKAKIESNVFTPVLSTPRQGPPMGLLLRGCSAPPHRCAPQPHPRQ